MDIHKEPTFIFYLSKDSLFFKTPFFIKLILFIIVGILSLMYQNLIFLTIVSLLALTAIFYLGLPFYNPKPLKLIMLSIILFSLFWLLFSNVSGGDTYVNFFWGTSISDATLEKMFLSITRWSSLALVGLLFISITSEKQLSDFLIRIRAPQKAILVLTISFNTVTFLIEDVKNIESSLSSRNIINKGILWKIKRIYLIGNTLLLSNIKRIDSLYQTYLFRSKS